MTRQVTSHQAQATSRQATSRRALSRSARPRRGVSLLGLGALAALTSGAPAALALDEQKGEAAAIKDCDRRLCAILLEKGGKGPDLKCALTKTWGQAKIKEADSPQMSWSYGDARCTVDLNLSREMLVSAMTADHVTLRVPSHTAHCVVEQNGKPETVTAVVAPKIEFRNGKAEKVWVRLKSVDGPTGIVLTVKTAAQLADSIGLFHGQMIKGINRYIERHCPKMLDVAATPAADKDKAAK